MNVHGCWALCGHTARLSVCPCVPVAESGNFQEEFLVIRESLIMPGVRNVFGSCSCFIFNDKLLLLNFIFSKLVCGRLFGESLVFGL